MPSCERLRAMTDTPRQPGGTRRQAVGTTGGPLGVAGTTGGTRPPTPMGLAVLRALKPSEDTDIGELVAARAAAVPVGDA